MSEPPAARPTRATSRRRRRGMRPGAVITVALLAGLVVWLLLRNSSSTKSTALRGTAATSVSPAALTSLAGSTGVPIFWAGPRAGNTYEYTRTSANRVYVRYLPAGVAVGSNHPYLTIGTYPLRNAYAVSQTVSARPGGVTVPVTGGIGFYSSSDPRHVYLAFPGVEFQVEVYDPAPGAARSLVAAGKVVPVSGKLPATPVGTSNAHAVSPAGLKALVTTVKHPIYWAGAQKGVTYEVTETSGGKVYLRYLPHGAPVGSTNAYLTVGTYPVKNAYSAVKSQAAKPGSAKLKLPGKAVAFYGKGRPTNVYVAYPGSSVEIEVYDPNAGAAARLVTSGRLTAVG